MHHIFMKTEYLTLTLTVILGIPAIIWANIQIGGALGKSILKLRPANRKQIIQLMKSSGWFILGLACGIGICLYSMESDLHLAAVNILIVLWLSLYYHIMHLESLK